MFKKQAEMTLDIREKMRGGDGSVKLLHVFNADEFKGKGRMLAKVTLEPGCSIGDHVHDQEEEVYYVLSGHGIVDDNGQVREIGPGDAVKTGGGEHHSIKNTGNEPLVFMAVIFLFA